MTTRRSLFTLTVGAMVAEAVPVRPQASGKGQVAPAHPDAELIAICAEHDANLVAFNASNLDSDVCPHGQGYLRTLEVIDAAKPQTIAGMLAKARSARAETRLPDGSDNPEGSTLALKWAWDLMNDLLAEGTVA